MTDRERTVLRTEAAFDQSWRDIEEELADIQRITLGMSDPALAGDALLVRRCLCLLVGELYRRRSLRHDDPTPLPE